jgi:aminotransferase
MNEMSVVKSLMKESSALKAAGREIVSLGVGVPFYGMPREMKQYCMDLMQNSTEIDGYTPFPGLPKLREVVARQFSNEMSREVLRENVLITAGSMSGLYYVFRALLEKGDEVIVPAPYFLSYKEQIEMCGGKLIEAPTCDDWGLDVEAIGRLVNEKTKAILINSPNNPTGAVYSEESLRLLGQLAIEHDLVVITDEAYDYLVYGKYFNLAWDESMKERVVRCGSYSKRFGMTGWRVGYLFAEGEMMERIMRVHDNITVCAPHLGQEAVWYGLTHELGEVEGNLVKMAENRKLMLQKLEELGEDVIYASPEGAFYVMLKYPGSESSVETTWSLLRDRGLVVLPGGIFGNRGEGYLRLSFGGERGEMLEALRRFGEWVSELKD